MSRPKIGRSKVSFAPGFQNTAGAFRVCVGVRVTRLAEFLPCFYLVFTLFLPCFYLVFTY
jgi:hypothetical protein